MADVSFLYQVATGENVVAEDHNSLVRAIGNLNTQGDSLNPALSTFQVVTGSQDGGWAGVKTNCSVDAATGYLIGSYTDAWTGLDLWDGTDIYDPGWQDYAYRTTVQDIGAAVNVLGTVTAQGNLPGGVAITAYWSLDGVTFNPWNGTQTGDTLALAPVRARYAVFEIAVTQAGFSPNYLSGLDWALIGPQYGEAGVLDIAVGGSALVFAREYLLPPAVLVTPRYQANQDVIPRVYGVSTTDAQIELVLLNPLGTSINGRVSYQVVSQ